MMYPLCSVSLTDRPEENKLLYLEFPNHIEGIQFDIKIVLILGMVWY